jgi:hypothetical protein
MLVIKEYIAESVKALRPTSHYRHKLEFLLQHGRTFTEIVASLPPRTRRTPKRCYANAARFAQRWPDYSYCEGLALGERGLIDHAWCIDAAGRVAEATWKAPGVEYLGVVFKPVYLARLLRELGMYGVLEEAAQRLTDGRDSLAEALYQPKPGLTH